LIEEAELMLARDIDENKQLSEHGASHISENCSPSQDGYSILTHCNTGSLATAGYGTALGMLPLLHEHVERSFVVGLVRKITLSLHHKAKCDYKQCLIVIISKRSDFQE